MHILEVLLLLFGLVVLSATTIAYFLKSDYYYYERAKWSFDVFCGSMCLIMFLSLLTTHQHQCVSLSRADLPVGIQEFSGFGDAPNELFYFRKDDKNNYQYYTYSNINTNEIDLNTYTFKDITIVDVPKTVRPRVDIEWNENKYYAKLLWIFPIEFSTLYKIKSITFKVPRDSLRTY